ncbi:MAG: S8 family serine peptidase [Gemmatimonadaceae bacterium]|nr:S8 family serine peptidase [Gemmatimonadaceae bacterium]
MHTFLQRRFLVWSVGLVMVYGVASAAAISAQAAMDTAKLDPPLQVAIREHRSARVIVLGRTQLFAPVGGLDTFQRRFATSDRLALRATVVRTLKANAAREQTRILRALQRPAAEQRLWILNAMSLELSAADLARVSRLRDVMYVYAGGEPIASRIADTPPILTLPNVPRPDFTASGKRVAWNVAHLNAPRVWTELGNTGRGSIIAVLDNGANYAHQDLRSNVWTNRREVPNNGLDDDRNGWIDDVYGYDFGSMSAQVRDTSSGRQHGTMTSGIAVGDGSGGIVTGVAPRAQVMLLKITGGNVDAAGNRPIAAALAYQYALENGADILSMSFSLPGLGNLRGYWRMMSDHAVAAGLFLVGGAGNFRVTQPIPIQHQSPKDVPSVVSVGGIDTLRQLVSFSSMGPAEWSSVALYGDYPLPKGIIKPDVVAFPGEGYPVLSITDSGYIDTNVTRIRGNSFAGPQVAGIAALLFADQRGMSVWRAREIIERSARPLGDAGKNNMFGYGLVDAFAAVTLARNENPSRASRPR